MDHIERHTDSHSWLLWAVTSHLLVAVQLQKSWTLLSNWTATSRWEVTAQSNQEWESVCLSMWSTDTYWIRISKGIKAHAKIWKLLLSVTGNEMKGMISFSCCSKKNLKTPWKFSEDMHRLSQNVEKTTDCRGTSAPLLDCFSRHEEPCHQRCSRFSRLMVHRRK